MPLFLEDLTYSGGHLIILNEKKKTEKIVRVTRPAVCQMADDKTANHYSITEGTVIQLVLELKAGFEVY